MLGMVAVLLGERGGGCPRSERLRCDVESDVDALVVDEISQRLDVVSGRLFDGGSVTAVGAVPDRHGENPPGLPFGMAQSLLPTFFAVDLDEAVRAVDHGHLCFPQVWALGPTPARSLTCSSCWRGPGCSEGCGARRCAARRSA